MKNKILMIISLTFLVSTFIIVTNISFFKQDVVEQKAEAVNENVIVLDKNSLSFTLKEKEKLSSLDGIKNIDFTKSSNEATVDILETNNGQGNDEEKYAFTEVVTLNDFENDYDNFEYVAGGKIKSENGAVISDLLANELLEFKAYSDCKTIDDLIGKTLKTDQIEELSFEDLKIDGIYKTDHEVEKVQKTKSFYENMFTQINFSSPQIYTNQKPIYESDIEESIIQYNYNILFNEENYNTYISNDYQEPVDKNGDFDYDLAIKQGYKGLIDPDTDVYGTDEELSNRVYITFKDKDSYKKAVEELNSGSLKSIGDQSIITTKDNYKSYLMGNLSFSSTEDSHRGLIVLFTAILTLLYLKFFKGNFKNVVIDYILAAIIAYTLATIIAVVMNVTPFYTQSIAITMIPLVILLIIGMIYNKLWYKN